MLFLSTAAVLIAAFAMIYGLFLLVFKKGRRKFGLLLIGLAPIAATVILLVSMSSIETREARDAGFESASDQRRAAGFGITDPNRWEEVKAEMAAEEPERARIAAEREVEKKRAEEARAAAEKDEERRKGFHCLSAWDGSHTGFTRTVKENLRDPKSFEHMSTRVTPVSDEGTHIISMTYRARNGFGGMNVETAMGVYDHESCRALFLGSE